MAEELLCGAHVCVMLKRLFTGELVCVVRVCMCVCMCVCVRMCTRCAQSDSWSESGIVLDDVVGLGTEVVTPLCFLGHPWEVTMVCQYELVQDRILLAGIRSSESRHHCRVHCVECNLEVGLWDGLVELLQFLTEVFDHEGERFRTRTHVFCCPSEQSIAGAEIPDSVDEVNLLKVLKVRLVELLVVCDGGEQCCEALPHLHRGLDLLLHRRTVELGLSHRRTVELGLSHRRTVELGLSHRRTVELGLSHRRTVELGLLHFWSECVGWCDCGCDCGCHCVCGRGLRERGCWRGLRERGCVRGCVRGCWCRLCTNIIP